MHTFAQALADGGPGPWILVFPLAWAAAVAGVVTFLRRTGRRGPGRGGPWGGGPWRAMDARRPAGDSPLAVLGRRFAAGEIDEEEYWRRMSVLDEHFGATGRNPAL